MFPITDLCCCRRPKSDDFVIVSFVISVLTIVSGILGLFLPRDSCTLENPVNLSFAQWSEVEEEYGMELHGWLHFIIACSILTAVSVLFLLLAFLSISENCVRHENRKFWSGLVFYFLSITMLVAFIMGWVLVDDIYRQDLFYNCAIDQAKKGMRFRILLHIVATLSITDPVLFVLILLFFYDPYRALRSTTEVKHALWCLKRIFFFCYYEHDSAPVFEDIATSFSVLFKDIKLTPSEIVKSLVLLHKKQKRGCQKVTFPPPLKEPRGCCSRVKERVSHQARHFPVISSLLASEVRMLVYYSKYFMGTYGWMLYFYERPVTAFLRLCTFQPCGCCVKRGWEERGGLGCCRCDATALQKITGLKNEQVAFTNFKSNICHPSYYVALDDGCPEDGHVDYQANKELRDCSQGAVVIALRGTMSIEDCITDACATPSNLDAGPSAPPGPHYCHSGMLRCAENVYQELQEVGIIKKLVRREYPAHKRTIFLGHSLGAGTAVILTILMRARHPEIADSITCISYSPPGALISKELSEYVKSFTIAAFVGLDVIPRLTVHTFNDLKKNMEDMLKKQGTARPANKSLLRSLFSSRKAEEQSQNCDLEQPGLGFVNLEPGEGTEREPQSPMKPILTPASTKEEKASALITVKLYPPAQLIHFVKAVTRSTLCSSEEFYYPVHISSSDLQTIFCAAQMLWDHFPDRIYYVLNSTYEKLTRGELNRFAHPKSLVESGNASSSVRIDMDSSPANAETSKQK